MGKNNKAKRKAKSAAIAKQAARSRSLPVIPNVRSCDGCTACCAVFGVEEIAKPAWDACVNLTESGCSIYAARPNHCRGFYCLYQHGMGKLSDRPDKIGAIFAPTNGVTEFTGETEIQAYEITPRAFNDPEVIRLAETFADKGKLVIGHCFGGSEFRFVGPPAKVHKATIYLTKK